MKRVTMDENQYLDMLNQVMDITATDIIGIFKNKIMSLENWKKHKQACIKMFLEDTPWDE